MRILVIQGENNDVQWLTEYMGRYASDVQVKDVHALEEAQVLFQDTGNQIDVIVIDTTIPGVLTPRLLFGLVMAAPVVPLVLLMNKQTFDYECLRLPGTRVFELRTDISTEAFLHHITTLVREVQQEAAVKAAQG